MDTGASDIVIKLILSIIIAIVGYGFFPVCFALFRPKISRKKYYVISYLVNILVFLIFYALDGNPNAAPYAIWTALGCFIGKSHLPEVEPTPPVSYADLPKHTYEEIESMVPDDVIQFCKSKRGNRQELQEALEAMAMDRKIPYDYILPLLNEYMKPVGQNKKSEEKKIEKTGNTRSSNTKYIAVISALSVLVIVLIVALVSAPTKEDISESYDSGFKVGYASGNNDGYIEAKKEWTGYYSEISYVKGYNDGFDDGKLDSKKNPTYNPYTSYDNMTDNNGKLNPEVEYKETNIPREILADHYLDLIFDSGFIDLYGTDEGNIFETLDDYFLFGTVSDQDAKAAYLELSQRCFALMSEFADCIVESD